MRDALQDGIALLGTALASIGSAGYLPDSVNMIAAGGGGLALVAMLEKSWRNNKDEIIEEIEDFVEEKTGLDIELDEAIEEVVDAAIDTAKDIVMIDFPKSLSPQIKGNFFVQNIGAECFFKFGRQFLTCNIGV